MTPVHITYPPLRKQSNNQIERTPLRSKISLALSLAYFKCSSMPSKCYFSTRKPTVFLSIGSINHMIQMQSQCDYFLKRLYYKYELLTVKL